MSLDALYFDAASTTLDCEFIESLTLTKSTKSGRPEPFRLLAPHRKLVINLLGWKIADESTRECDITSLDEVTIAALTCPYCKSQIVPAPGGIACSRCAREFAINQTGGARSYRRAYFSPARKNSKALALDTAIPTPSGWKEMGELVVGDLVYDGHGIQTAVTHVSEVFVDHDCYEVEFSNEQKIVADAGHEWETSARVFKPGGTTGEKRLSREAPNERSPVTRKTTEAIFKTQRFGKRGDVNHTVALGGPLENDEVILPIAPYVLGAWLGDGHSAGARLTAGDQDRAAMCALLASNGVLADPNAGPSFMMRTEGPLGLGVSVGKGSADNLQYLLRVNGLINNKHIPAIYLRGSIGQRLSLLQGLMDTDGTINKNGRVLSFTSTLEALANGVGELLASLGIKYTIIPRKMTCNGRPVPGLAYQVQFNVFRDEVPVFALKRKIDRMRLRSNSKSRPRSRSLQIVKVTKVPTVPVRCIAVASEVHTYLCGRTMIPTHNTTIAAAIALDLLILDGEASPEIYVAAKDRDQAGICYAAAAMFVFGSEDLRDVVKVVDYQKEIRNPLNGGKLKALSSDGKGKHGYNPSCVIIDEFHVWGAPEQELYDALTSGSVARRQPLTIIITTAGIDEYTMCGREYEYACKVRDRIVEDTTYLPLIYELPKDADWTDEALWHLPNPTLGEIVRVEALREARDKALTIPSEQTKFRRLAMNQWINSRDIWIATVSWDACLWGGGAI